MLVTQRFEPVTVINEVDNRLVSNSSVSHRTLVEIVTGMVKGRSVRSVKAIR